MGLVGEPEVTKEVRFFLNTLYVIFQNEVTYQRAVGWLQLSDDHYFKRDRVYDIGSSVRVQDPQDIIV